MNTFDPRIIFLLPVVIILFLFLNTFLSQLQKLSCESYCQQVATESYNKGYQTGESKGFNEGYTKGYKECEEIYKSKYSECLGLLNLTNLSLQNCTKEL
jgi:flagellar biosynthesis/type III secretory pathway protein FliH